jgi:pyruvate dehydrogenase E2 component (dihydrolipoamide acetyltransferase)
MPTEIFMPALGMNQEYGKIIEWLAREGQNVIKGHPVMVVETDKATVEIEAPATGKLINVTARDGEEVPVGKVIALVVNEGETVTSTPVLETIHTSSVVGQPPDSVSPGAIPMVKPATLLAARIAEEYVLDLSQVPCEGKQIKKEDVLAYLAGQSVLSQTQAGRKLASPKARRLAREHNIDLHGLSGSGPEGAVLAVDVDRAAEAETSKAGTRQALHLPRPILKTVDSASGEPSQTQIPTGRMWQVMAQRMTESWQTIPQFNLQTETDATQLKAWRTRLADRLVEKVTYTDLIIKLVAIALHQHPRLNASWVNGVIRSNAEINIGLAVAVEDGLLVPVIHDAGQLGVQALAARREALVSGAKTNRLGLADLTGGTFTVSNLGMYGVDVFQAIINPPEAAILALGRITDRAVPVNGTLEIQPRLTMVLTCDHRVVDGARAAQFLQTLVRLIEDPLALLD